MKSNPLAILGQGLAIRPLRAVDFILAIVVFAATLNGYLHSPMKPNNDGVWTYPTTLSLLKYGNQNLNWFFATPYCVGQVAPGARFGVKKILPDGKVRQLDKVEKRLTVTKAFYANFFPLGPSLIAMPHAIVNQWLGRGDLYTLDRDACEVACLATALAAALLFLTLRAEASIWLALLLTGVFAFATNAWSCGTAGLLQHGPSMLCLTAGLLLFTRGYGGLAGFPLALSYLMRPTNQVVLLVFGLLLLIQNRKQAYIYALCAALVIVPWLLYNLHFLHRLLPWYYSSYRGHPSFVNTPEALPGLLISPNRGLFVFSPILLLAPIGAWMRWREKQWRPLDTAMMLSCIGVWAASATFIYWWAGFSFGPRILTDIGPFLVMGSVYPIQRLCRARWSYKAPLGVLVVAALAFSGFVQYRGAVDFAGSSQWNVSFRDNVNRQEAWVDKNSKRVWDWSDLQFLRRP